MLDLVLEQAGETEPGFARKIVKWAINCTAEGRYTGVVSLGDEKGRIFDSCPHLSQPQLVGGGASEPRAHFLTESLPTVALLFDDKTKEKDRARCEAKHEWFVKILHRAALAAPYLDAAAKLLSDADTLAQIRSDLKKYRVKPAEYAVIIIDGTNPLERDDWHEWWREFRASLGVRRGKNRGEMRCVITGEIVEPAATHPKIGGLASVGGLRAKDVLVGFDKMAFQSYGLEQAANAAMSEATATAYAETLSRLITDRNVKLGNTLAVWWYTGQREPPRTDEVMAWFTEPPEQTAGAAERRAHTLLNAIRTGQREDLVGNRFVALMLSGASGRVMVREVIQGSFEELVAHTEAWFHDLAIVARDGKRLAIDPKFLAVTGSLVRDLKDLPSPWLQQLWRAAVTGGLIPAAMLAQAITRARSDFIKRDSEGNARDRALRFSQRHTRMALIKACLVRNHGDLFMQPYLNPDHPHPAYHCGRALALFARLQRAALGSVGANVVQRYYTAASQTPGLVLGRLASNAKNHLGKLSGGLAIWYEKQLAEILGCIKDVVPSTLTLQEQSLFALGYYQQLAHFWAGKQGLPDGEVDEEPEATQSE